KLPFSDIHPRPVYRHYSAFRAVRAVYLVSERKPGVGGVVFGHDHGHLYLIIEVYLAKVYQLFAEQYRADVHFGNLIERQSGVAQHVASSLGTKVGVSRMP